MGLETFPRVEPPWIQKSAHKPLLNTKSVCFQAPKIFLGHYLEIQDKEMEGTDNQEA